MTSIMERIGEWLAGFGDRDVCQTCGLPGRTLHHRQKCLRKSEDEIYRILKENKANGVK